MNAAPCESLTLRVSNHHKMERERRSPHRTPNRLWAAHVWIDSPQGVPSLTNRSHSPFVWPLSGDGTYKRTVALVVCGITLSASISAATLCWCEYISSRTPIIRFQHDRAREVTLSLSRRQWHLPLRMISNRDRVHCVVALHEQSCRGCES